MSNKTNKKELEKFYTIAYAFENAFMYLEHKMEQKGETDLSVNTGNLWWRVYCDLGGVHCKYDQQDVIDVFYELVLNGSIRWHQTPINAGICNRTRYWSYSR